MLLIVYGLRSLELRRLRLEDVDWEQELIRVTRFKSRCVQVYPLSDSLGEALLRYLKEARPLTQYREVFLTRRAPIQPLSSSGLVNLVARRMQRLGILPKHPGPHSLRHACATHLLTQGLSIKEIGDHLGHRDPDSTLTYAKVDLAALRRVADFNLEVLE
jgi:integrase/recombinase XerD